MWLHTNSIRTPVSEKILRPCCAVLILMISCDLRAEPGNGRSSRARRDRAEKSPKGIKHLHLMVVGPRLRHQEASVFHFLIKFCCDNYMRLPYAPYRVEVFSWYLTIGKKKKKVVMNSLGQSMVWIWFLKTEETCSWPPLATQSQGVRMSKMY